MPLLPVMFVITRSIKQWITPVDIEMVRRFVGRAGWTRSMLLAPLVVVTAASPKFYSLKIVCSRISCIQTPVLLPKC